MRRPTLPIRGESPIRRRLHHGLASPRANLLNCSEDEFIAVLVDNVVIQYLVPNRCNIATWSIFLSERTGLSIEPTDVFDSGRIDDPEPPVVIVHQRAPVLGGPPTIKR